MVENTVFVECEDTDNNKGNLSYWERKVEHYKAMVIPPYYPFREALNMVAELKGEIHE